MHTDIRSLFRHDPNPKRVALTVPEIGLHLPSVFKPVIDSLYAFENEDFEPVAISELYLGLLQNSNGNHSTATALTGAQIASFRGEKHAGGAIQILSRLHECIHEQVL